MSLEEYNKKRNFGKTTEPKGETKHSKEKVYSIQKHYASHLHYDLRLEIDGVLKSWAIPKEPDPKTKRLAVMTEDHPVDYAFFEGTIPKGEYGAGTVELYDSGTHELDENKESKIITKINGKKLKGTFVLIKLKRDQKNWLFFKKRE